MKDSVAKSRSRTAKIKGIYQRGNVFWFTRTVQGRRIQVSLETTEYAKAVAKALDVRADPFLHAADAFPDETKAFIAYKRKNNRYSRDSANTKKYALEEFASFVGKPDPAKVGTADVARYYDHIRHDAKRRNASGAVIGVVSESTAHGYIMTLRSFFNWMQPVRKAVRYNPALGGKTMQRVLSDT